MLDGIHPTAEAVGFLPCACINTVKSTKVAFGEKAKSILSNNKAKGDTDDIDDNVTEQSDAYARKRRERRKMDTSSDASESTNFGRQDLAEALEAIFNRELDIDKLSEKAKSLHMDSNINIKDITAMKNEEQLKDFYKEKFKRLKRGNTMKQICSDLANNNVIFDEEFIDKFGPNKEQDVREKVKSSNRDE